MSEEDPKALYLTFSYQGTNVQLDSLERINGLALPSDATQGHEEHAGFWIEVRDAADSIVYRRVMPNPTRHEVEVHAPHADESTQRFQQPLDTVEGKFVITIPDYDATHTLLMFNSPELHGVIDRSKAPGPAREVARFTLLATGI